jgi:predicted amidohydrolase
MSGTLVAALQFKPWRGAVEDNRARLLRLIEAAAEAGAELVVAPEMCNSGYVFPDREAILPYCETRHGQTYRLLSRAARRLGITLVYGWPEVEPASDRLFNSATVCFPEGEPLFYRKRLLYESDTTWAEPGDTPYPVWTTAAGLRATLGICMDLNDERFRDHLRESQARICAFPTNWLDQGFAVWNYWAYCLQRTRTCLVAANTYGVEDETPFRGESAVLDGRVLLGYAAPTGDDVVMACVPAEPTPLRPSEE